jgi:GNAT superfamily N-acetyltransferase
MMSIFRRLLPRTEKHFLLACDVLTLPTEFVVEGIDPVAVSADDRVRIELLDNFTARNGFPAGWVREMLADGAQAVVARDEGSNEILAMGWNTTRAFHIEEIGATLDPAGAVYFFGDFVAPAHRGRKLQRLLVAERLARMSDASRACTVIHPDNIASLRSYQSERFVKAAEFVRYERSGRTWSRCHTLPGAITRTNFVSDASGTILAQQK